MSENGIGLALAEAIIKASPSLITKVIELARDRDPNAQAKKTINKTYAKLSPVVTTNCVRVLIALRQAGSKQSLGQIAGIVEPMRQRQEPDSNPFEQDLKYRLYFLCLLGLVQQTLGEFAITHLGSAYLLKASDDRFNYSKAFVA